MKLYRVKTPTFVTLNCIKYLVKNRYDFYIDNGLDDDIITIKIKNMKQYNELESYFDYQILLCDIINAK